MSNLEQGKLWGNSSAYEPYVGRWSRKVAPEFLAWLAVAPQSRWLDIGCGTGALTQAILDTTGPQAVKGVDRSENYVQFAQAHVADERAQFDVGDAQTLTDQDATFDAAVSGLVLNFIPEPQRMVAEMARVTKPGGMVALYVWDYADKMQLMRYFWDAAIALDPAIIEMDEARKSPICNPQPLEQLFRAVGLGDVQVQPIDVPTVFVNFDDYWTPFYGGHAPAPRYAMSLDEERRAELREYIRSRLPIESDGSIHLIARVWAARGVASG